MDGIPALRTLCRRDHGVPGTKTEVPGGTNDPGDPEGHARTLQEAQERFLAVAARIDAVLSIERQRRRESRQQLLQRRLLLAKMLAAGARRWVELLGAVDNRDGHLLNALLSPWFRRVRMGVWALTRAGRRALATEAIE